MSSGWEATGEVRWSSRWAASTRCVNLLLAKNPPCRTIKNFERRNVRRSSAAGDFDIVAAREKSTSGSVDGSRWMSLRLDGCGFSKAVRMMRNKGVLEPHGFSATFAGDGRHGWQLTRSGASAAPR